MPEIDLTSKVPPTAQWIKLHYHMKPLKDDAQLIARVWSGGSADDAEVIRGPEGDVFVKMKKPQYISYQRPVNIDLQLKVVAYKSPE